MTTTHRTTARLTAGAAVLAVAAGVAGAAPAGARVEDNWVDGDWVQETIISCITGQPAPGYTGRVSFQGVGNRLPRVGEAFYVRMEVGLPGLPCNQTPLVLPEVLLPHGLEYADDAQHPVSWAMHDLDGGGSDFSTEGLVYDRGVNGGELIGLVSDDYPEGGPIEVRQGQSLEIRVPVRATKVMKGAGTRQPQCDERLAGDAPCPVDESGDHLQVAILKQDSGPMQYVIPFVGLLVQKAKATLGATFGVSPGKPGKATVTVKAPVAPTGKVTVLKGAKALGTGTLAKGDGGKLSISLPKLARGKHELVVKYAGSAAVAAVKRTFSVTSR